MRYWGMLKLKFVYLSILEDMAVFLSRRESDYISFLESTRKSKFATIGSSFSVIKETNKLINQGTFLFWATKDSDSKIVVVLCLLLSDNWLQYDAD